MEKWQEVKDVKEQTYIETIELYSFQKLVRKILEQICYNRF